MGFVLFASNLFGQSKREKPIVLTHADSLVGKVIDGETVREVIGKVEFRQDDVIVQCDRAVYSPRLNRADLFGNVTVIRDTVTMTAPRGVYDGEKKEVYGYDGVQLQKKQLVIMAKEARYHVDDKVAYFDTDVRVVDSTTTITARNLVYFESEHRSVASGDVKVINGRDNSTIYGQELEHFDDRRYSKMLMSPRFVQVDTSSSGTIDTLVIISRQMEAYDDSVRRFVAVDSVQMVRGDLSGKSARGIFYSNREIVVLLGKPIVWYERSQVSGDSILIELQKRRLQRVNVFRNTFAITQSDSLHPERLDQLSSKTMTLHFSDDELQQIVAEGTATSLYFLYEDEKPNGLNRASGDKIIVNSRKKRAHDIKVIGGTEGKYFPENMVSSSLSSYNLPGFQWRRDRPKLGKDLTIVALPTKRDDGSELKK